MILVTILIYFCILLIFSKITSRKANNETFYRGNRRSPWYMVAFGMVGASISGITFVSVPGMAYKMNMTYLQMCIGFIFGYFIVAFFLLPIYYKHNLTTIYSYLKDRMGNHSYKTGASFLSFPNHRSRSQILCCMHHPAKVCIRQFRNSIHIDSPHHGHADMVLYPQGWNQDISLDRYVPNFMYVFCLNPDYLLYHQMPGLHSDGGLPCHL